MVRKNSRKLQVRHEKYSFKDWIEIIKNKLDEEMHNPKFGLSHTLFAVRSDETIFGIVNLRHTITEFYKNSGHIGYNVRPSSRNKGYGKEIL